MKHLLYGAKSLFVDDAAADLLVDYAAHVAQQRGGDRVDLRGFSGEGNEVTASFLLNSGTNLAAETTGLRFDDLDNRAAVAYMRERLAAYAMSEDYVAGFQVLGEDVA